MAVKDYYKTLGISPQSGIPEIRRAYRRLAMQYHPDKNQDSPQATAQFREIQEAYHILSDPLLREKYHQERWLNRATGRKFEEPPLTPYAILLKAVELDRYMSRQDPFRTDRDGLLAYMQSVLSNDALTLLQKHGDTPLNNRIAALFLHAGRILDFNQVKIIGIRITELAPERAKDVERWINASKREMYWRRYKGWVALILAVLLSAFIYLVAKEN